MASIASLLNPLPDVDQLRVPNPAMPASCMMAPRTASRPKKEKPPKDAAIFKKDTIRGELRYPPCEQRDEELARIHREFQLFPMGEIASYPRHIPYNSDKKSFQDCTGRESFEVLQYVFTIPGNDKPWVVMWDYNIGLVRITHLFKCQGYSKTTPAKMLKANPGLRDICHSITGGAIAAQGYWMPFDAAKAVAATFCWPIRHILTPIFGLDFINMCIHPEDRGRYGRMTIDTFIVERSTQLANHYRDLELRALSHQQLLPSHRSSGSMPYEKPILPKSFNNHLHHGHRRQDSVDSLVGYGSSPGYSYGVNTDTYYMTPFSTIPNTPTPGNTSHGADAMTRLSGTPFPRVLYPLQGLSVRRTSDASDGGNGSGSGSGSGGSSSDAMNASSTLYSPTMSTDATSDCLSDFAIDDDDEDDDDVDYQDSSNEDSNPPQSTGKRSQASQVETRSRQTHPGLRPEDVEAAHTLMSIHMQDASGRSSDEQGFPRWQPTSGRKRRRASL